MFSLFQVSLSVRPFMLTQNTKLNKHIDNKYDNRFGYHHCVVYCFYKSIGNVTYRVFVIMTTQYTEWTAMDQICALKQVPKK